MTTVHEARVAAMGTTAKVMVVGGDEPLLDHLLWRLEALEAAWSRFRSDSEISTLHRRAGEFVYVSAETFDLVAKASFARELTAGAFDPLLREPLERLGYDRTFADIGHADHDAVGAPPSALWAPAVEDIALDHAGQAVRLPVGFGFDPGGIGKGLAADILAVDALDRGAAGVLVSIGGDLRVAGTPPDMTSWGVRLAEPAIGHDLDELLGLDHGAVATSTTKKRVWGDGLHHLLDPQTGRPHAAAADGSNPVLVTIVAGEAWYGDAMTKACFARPDFVPPATAGLIITQAGERATFGDFESLCIELKVSA